MASCPLPCVHLLCYHTAIEAAMAQQLKICLNQYYCCITDHQVCVTVILRSVLRNPQPYAYDCKPSRLLYHHHPVLICFFLVSEGGRMHLIPSAIAPTTSLHLAQSVASSTLNPILFVFSSTCFFHVCFGRLRFHGPFTSNIIACFKTLSSFLLTTCPYHLTPFALAILSNITTLPIL